MYIPPFKLARMMQEVKDRSSPEYQKLTWEVRAPPGHRASSHARRHAPAVAPRTTASTHVNTREYAQALKKSINGIINKVNVTNIKMILAEVFREVSAEDSTACEHTTHRGAALTPQPLPAVAPCAEPDPGPGALLQVSHEVAAGLAHLQRRVRRCVCALGPLGGPGASRPSRLRVRECGSPRHRLTARSARRSGCRPGWCGTC